MTDLDLASRVSSLEEQLKGYQSAGRQHAENIGEQLKETSSKAEEASQSAATANRLHEECRNSLSSIQADYQELVNFRDTLSDWQTEYQKLRAAYEEQLHLQGPARMWRILAARYRRQSLFLLLGATTLTVALITTAIVFAYKPPASFLSTQGNILGYNQIKTAILLAVGLSFGVYLLRAVVKLTFSAFHLQRDAVERRQLTSVYLGLIRLGAADPHDREAILQALFSRADTGLLTGDSGPTMPGSQLSQFLRPDRDS